MEKEQDMKTISIIGNLTADCEIKTVGGKSVINFTVAVNEKYTDKLGNKINDVMFFDCGYWHKDENNLKISESLKKGIQVYVSGLPYMNVYLNKQNEACGNIRIHAIGVNPLS